MFRILFLVALSGVQTLRAQQADCPAIPDSTPIQPVGAFSNMRYTEEHAYGYTVYLWRAGKCRFGLFEASEGLSGDTPTGMLTQLRYHRGTATLTFLAKLTTGVTKPGNEANWVPSRDFFNFNGRLGPRAIKGRLRRSDQLRPELRAVDREIVLSLSKQQEEFMIQAGNYGEWRKQAESILKARGPKW